MNRLRVVTWNAEGMFVEGAKTRRAKPQDAIKALAELDADILVVPEFGRQDGLTEGTRNAIGSFGYELIEVAYDDLSMTDKDANEIAILSRIPVSVTKVHRYADVRNSIEIRAKIGGHEVRVYAVHLDDKAEETRLLQVKDLAVSIAKDKHTPTLLMGDFNAMDRVSKFARLSRSRLAKSVSNRVKHEQLKGVAVRLHEMAIGTTIEYIDKHTHLHNLDTRHKLTISGKQAGLEWMPSVRLAKIDWVFGSRHFKVIRYRVHRDVGSDHRPVVVDVEFS